MAPTIAVIDRKRRGYGELSVEHLKVDGLSLYIHTGRYAAVGLPVTWSG